MNTGEANRPCPSCCVGRLQWLLRDQPPSWRQLLDLSPYADAATGNAQPHVAITARARLSGQLLIGQRHFHAAGFTPAVVTFGLIKR